jgi:hypothetical protein
MQRGDIETVHRCNAELAAIAGTLRQPTRSWIAGAREPWRLLLEGDAVNAERAAEETLRLGGESGQPDAFLIYGGQLMNIRWHQGRLREVVPLLEQMSAATPGMPGLEGGLAWASAEGGDLDTAQRLVDKARGNGFDLPYDMVWLGGTSLWADTAAQLGDAASAGQLYRRLAPWHDQTVFTGIVDFGAVAQYLGQLAVVLSHIDAAVIHFAEALEIHQRLRAPFHIARTKLEWGRLLLDRDRKRATALLGEAHQLATQYGCGRVERLADEALSRLGSLAGPASG